MELPFPSFFLRSTAPHTGRPGRVRVSALLIGLVAAVVLSGCDRADAPAAVVKISVYRDGGLIVSGFRTDPQKFDAAVVRMREKPTTVWLYAEAAPGIGTAIERSVRGQLATADIPCRTFADEGFTQPQSDHAAP